VGERPDGKVVLRFKKGANAPTCRGILSLCEVAVVAPEKEGRVARRTTRSSMEGAAILGGQVERCAD